jgi:hypothetical protein
LVFKIREHIVSLGGGSNISDETLLIINKSKHPKRGKIQGTKKEEPMSKKTKEPRKEGKPLWSIKFLNPLQW